MNGESRPGSDEAGCGSPPRKPRIQTRFLSRSDATLLGLGTQVMSEVGAGVLAGLGIDYLLGTQNRWVVVGSIAGVVVAMWTMIRTALRLRPPSTGGGADAGASSRRAEMTGRREGAVERRDDRRSADPASRRSDDGIPGSDV